MRSKPIDKRGEEMSTEVFNRYEKKFILDQKTYEGIIKILDEHMTLDVYNQVNGFYTISNLYCDTEDSVLIRKSLSKPIYKEKLRIRAYGVPELESNVFLEIKKKYKGLVNKRRTGIQLTDAYHFISSKEIPEKKPYQNRQVMNEIQFMLHQYNLKPVVYIAYDRKALFDNDLRITFDTNIRTRRFDLGLEYGDYGRPLLNKGQWLMEVKAEKTLPMWFVRLLSEYKLYAVSFSKYGKEFMTKDEDNQYHTEFIKAKQNIEIEELLNLKGEKMTCLRPCLAHPQQAVH